MDTDVGGKVKIILQLRVKRSFARLAIAYIRLSAGAYVLSRMSVHANVKEWKVSVRVKRGLPVNHSAKFIHS